MLKSKVSADMLLGIAAQGLQYGAALLLLPFIVVNLSSEETGIWYVFMTIQGLVSVLDFGFQPTFARNFSLAFSGVNILQKVGISQEKPGEPNYALVSAVLSAAKIVYAGIAIVVFISLLTIGSWYVNSLIADSVGLTVSTHQAWVIFSLAVTLNIYFLWYSPLLIGAGRIKQNYIYLIVNRASFALIGIACLYLGFGLTSLAFSYLAGVVLARLVVGLFIREVKVNLVDNPGRAKTFKKLRLIWYNASRLGLVSVGTFLIVRYNVFVISHFMGLSAVASYAITLQVFSAVKAVAQLPFQVMLPQMVAARVAKNIKGLKHIFLRSTGFYLAVFLSGFLFLSVAGQAFFGVIGSKVELLPSIPMFLMGIVMVLEGNHSNCAFFISTENKIPFVWPALLSGVGIALLSTIFAWLGYGLLGVLLAQGLIQLTYNNWKWPMVVFKSLRAPSLI